jgi:hypothetical protein
MRNRLTENQIELFQPPRQVVEFPPEVRQKMIHLLARLLEQHVARSLRRAPVAEANHE